MLAVAAIVSLSIAAASSQPSGKEAVEISSVYAGGHPGSGRVVGRVTLENIVPPRKIIVTKDADQCGKEKPDETYLFSSDLGLRNVVVWLEGVVVGKDPVKTPIVLKNITCSYEPRVAVGSLGNTLEIRNYDPVQHNSHVYRLNPAFGFFGATLRNAVPDPATSIFNIALPVKGFTVRRKLDQVGLLDIRNDAGHPWMHAWLWVFAHPYATVTDEAGEFAIDRVPPGNYQLRTWHEGGGYKTATVTVASGDTRIDLSY